MNQITLAPMPDQYTKLPSKCYKHPYFDKIFLNWGLCCVYQKYSKCRENSTCSSYYHIFSMPFPFFFLSLQILGFEHRLLQSQWAATSLKCLRTKKKKKNQQGPSPVCSPFCTFMSRGPSQGYPHLMWYSTHGPVEDSPYLSKTCIY